MWTWQQLLPAGLWLVLIAAAGLYLSKRTVHRRLFLLALAVKVFLGLVVLPLYHQMSGQGDILSYYHQSRVMGQMLAHHPEHAGAYLWPEVLDEKELNAAIAIQNSEVPEAEPYVFLVSNPAGSRMMRLVWLLSWPAAHSYWAIHLLFTTLAFVGSWLLFLAWLRLMKGYCLQLSLVILFLPNVLFWTSGMGKDAVMMLGIGLGAWLCSQSARHWLLLPLALLLIGSLRPNVVPVAMVLWLAQLAMQQQHLRPTRRIPGYLYLALALLLVLGIALLVWGRYGGFPLLQYPIVLRYTMLPPGPVPQGEAVLQLAPFVHHWQWYMSELPYALWGTLTMPHPAQVHSPIQLAAMLEAWVLVAGMLYLWYRAVATRRQVSSTTILVGVVLLLSGLGFLLSVGLCVPYVGTMVRYRIYGWLLILLGSLLCGYRPFRGSDN